MFEVNEAPPRHPALPPHLIAHHISLVFVSEQLMSHDRKDIRSSRQEYHVKQVRETKCECVNQSTEVIPQFDDAEEPGEESERAKGE